MIKSFILLHPQSLDQLPAEAVQHQLVKPIYISCGTTKNQKADYSESNDFFPTYASLNSILFETSVILTIWEHANELIGDNHVAFLHSDIIPHFDPDVIWPKIHQHLDDESPVGLTVPITQRGLYDEWLVPPETKFTPDIDPLLLHSFDYNVHVWDLVKKYDPHIYEWAFTRKPRLIYSHQFACTRKLFDILGNCLTDVIRRLKIADIGLWTPHMFERLIALYLAKHGQKPQLTTAFWHSSSSGAFGPGELKLYGPRPRKFFRLNTRYSPPSKK